MLASTLGADEVGLIATAAHVPPLGLQIGAHGVCYVVQQPKLMYAVSPCRVDRLARSPGGLRLVAARQIVQQVQRSCAHAWCSALRGPRGGRQRAEGSG